MRAAAQLISYEVAQGLSLLGVAMTAGTLSLTGIVNAQRSMWFVVPQIVGCLIFITSGLAEINRTPFDLVEADAELVSGFNTEYGGLAFPGFLLAEYLNMIVLAGIITTVFFGGWLLPFGLHAPGWVDPIVVIVKMMLCISVVIWIRFTLPRLRYDQVMAFGWKVLLPLATLNFLVTAVTIIA
jgi:NADH-quinone oxidoreductase subunit H